MTWPLNNVTTADTYTQANTIERVSGHKLSGAITNNAAFLQLKRGPEPGTWEQEVFIPPAFISLTRDWPIVGYRVRSGAAGSAAQVSLDLT